MKAPFVALVLSVTVGVTAIALSSHFWGFRGALAVTVVSASLLAGCYALVVKPDRRALAATIALFLSTCSLSAVLLIPQDWPVRQNAQASITTQTPASASTPRSGLFSMAGRNLRSIDLSGLNLANADFRGADLSGANLTGADLSNSCLRGAVLSGARTSGASFAGADLSGATADFPLPTATPSATACS